MCGDAGSSVLLLHINLVRLLLPASLRLEASESGRSIGRVSIME